MIGEILIGSLVFFGLSAILFAPLESLLPARAMRERPPLSDWVMFLLNPALGAWFSLAVLATLAATIRVNLPADFRAAIIGAPIAVQLVLVVVLAQLWTYWVHRLSHRSNLLWRFHRVHHTIEHMTWASAHRQHPVDVVLMIAGANFPAFVLGVDLRPLTAFIIVERCYTVLLHSNLDFSYGWFDRILASPRFHHWHHDADGTGQRHNFAGMFSLLDWVFGTWHPPTEPPRSFGPGDASSSNATPTAEPADG